ncbi:MAG: M20/M25/M40 family metallo-hydrolase [Thermoleophilaceae bacterium]|nr:M20/M25/M40 family metallo-hydrolase [Thermoleophilaceae bacterium]
MDERALTERLITYNTSTLDGIRSCSGFVKGWLDSHDVPVSAWTCHGRPILAATVGAAEGPTIVLHGHLDVVPAYEEQFEPRLDGDRLIGRGAYDMKGGLAGMMCATCDLVRQDGVRVHLLIVCDEEADEDAGKGTEALIDRGYLGDFAITGEPTDLLIGVQAKGVLALRLEVLGKAAHGSTPWLGDNAALKAIDVFRRIESLPFSRASSELFDRPSINLGRISGGDALNKVPDVCTIDVDIRYLPGQDPEQILASVRDLPETRVSVIFQREPAIVDRDHPLVSALADAVRDRTRAEAISVGRDGASDAVSFLEAGVPAVEFGPTGGGHHGPDEWVSVESLHSYRRALVDFVEIVPTRVSTPRLRIA